MKKILVIGNFTRDVNILDSGKRSSIGGPPYYIHKALKYYSDLKLIIVSSIGNDFPRESINDLCKDNVECILKQYSTPTISFVNDYRNVVRKQSVKGGGYKITAEQIRSVGKVDFSIVSPVLDEVDKSLLEEIKSRSRVAVDPQGFLRVLDDGMIRLASSDLSYYQGVDILKPSVEEFRVLTRDLKDLYSILNIVRGYVVVSSGDKGAYLLIDGFTYYIPAYKVKGVDVTGAGDMFIGSLIYSLVKGTSILDSCIYSNAVVSILLERDVISSDLLNYRINFIKKGLKIFKLEKLKNILLL